MHTMETVGEMPLVHETEVTNHENGARLIEADIPLLWQVKNSALG
jgi:hypothetical protein